VAIEGTKAGFRSLEPGASPEAMTRYELLRAESYRSEDTRARLAELIKPDDAK